jgi:UDP-N-acetylglucosamine 2-epimerase (non-hydrolysing)
VKVLTVLGTRPEIIRLSAVIPLLDEQAEHVLVHTGQNFDDRLNELFFRELSVRKPDVYMNVRGASFADQVGQILAKIEPILREHAPDRLLVLGDTNSGLTAIIARRMGIAVYHMEAGNRCYDDRVPEEVNRRVIDHASSVLMPYTQRSRENLLREGIPGERVFVTGNPIREVIEAHAGAIDASRVLSDLGVAERGYFLVTMHRAENVDREDRLAALVRSLHELSAKYRMPVICSTHPRTRARMSEFGIRADDANVRFLEPLGFFDFVRLEKSAFCILSDSGTVQEEACILKVPAVTIRDVTERPETIECGSNILSGCESDRIAAAVKIVTAKPPAWEAPPEYQSLNVAAAAVRVLLGFRLPDRAEIEWRATRSRRES